MSKGCLEVCVIILFVVVVITWLAHHKPVLIALGAVCVTVTIVVLALKARRRTRPTAMSDLRRPAVLVPSPQIQVDPTQGADTPLSRPPNSYFQFQPQRQQSWSMPAPPYASPSQPSFSTTPAPFHLNDAPTPVPHTLLAPRPAALPPEHPTPPHNPSVEVHFPTPPPSLPPIPLAHGQAIQPITLAGPGNEGEPSPYSLDGRDDY